MLKEWMQNDVQNIHCCLSRKDNLKSSPTRSHRRWQSFSEMWLFFWVIGEAIRGFWMKNTVLHVLLASPGDAVGATLRVPHNLVHLFSLLLSFSVKQPLALQKPPLPSRHTNPPQVRPWLMSEECRAGRLWKTRLALRQGNSGVQVKLQSSHGIRLKLSPAETSSIWTLFFSCEQSPNKSWASKPLSQALLLENPS